MQKHFGGEKMNDEVIDHLGREVIAWLLGLSACEVAGSPQRGKRDDQTGPNGSEAVHRFGYQEGVAPLSIENCGSTSRGSALAWPRERRPRRRRCRRAMPCANTPARASTCRDCRRGACRRGAAPPPSAAWPGRRG